MTSVEDFAMRIGRYVPRDAVAGSSYFSGSVRIDPAKAASGGALSAAAPRDEYIPSNLLPAPVEDEGAPENADANAKDVNNTDEDKTAEGEFTPEEQRVIQELKTTDQKVRSHEQAHVAVGGQYVTGGPTYEYEKGPDNQRYAVGGEVGIDSSPVSDNPEATIAKMQVVRAAALAPPDPSPQDRAVASAASREEGQARAELREKRIAEAREGADGAGSQDSTQNEGARQSRVIANAVSAYTNVNIPQESLINIAA